MRGYLCVCVCACVYVYVCVHMCAPACVNRWGYTAQQFCDLLFNNTIKLIVFCNDILLYGYTTICLQLP